MSSFTEPFFPPTSSPFPKLLHPQVLLGIAFIQLAASLAASLAQGLYYGAVDSGCSDTKQPAVIYRTQRIYGHVTASRPDFLARVTSAARQCWPLYVCVCPCGHCSNCQRSPADLGTINDMPLPTKDKIDNTTTINLSLTSAV